MQKILLDPSQLIQEDRSSHQSNSPKFGTNVVEHLVVCDPHRCKPVQLKINLDLVSSLKNK